MAIKRLSVEQLGEIYPGFASWFAGSRVHDRSFRPLLCMHGTVGEHYGAHPLMHFGTPHAAHERIRLETTSTCSPDPDIIPHLRSLRDYSAEARRKRAGRRAMKLYHIYPEGANLLPAYLRICKPFNMNLDPTSIVMNDYTDAPISGLEDDHLGLCLGLGMKVDDIRTNLRLQGSGERLVRWAMELVDIDGVHYPNYFEDYGRRSWIIRDPSQVWFLDDVNKLP